MVRGFSRKYKGFQRRKTRKTPYEACTSAKRRHGFTYAQAKSACARLKRRK